MGFLLQNYGILQQDQQSYDISGITAWYLFNGNSPNDLSGNAYTLALISGSTSSNLPFGKNPDFRISGNTAFNVGTVGTFGGTGLTNQSLVSHSGFDYASDATLMCWMKIDAFPNYQSPVGFIQSKKMWRFYVTNDPTKYIVAQRYDGAVNNTITATGIPNPTVGEWYHLAMVITTDGAGKKIRFFVDGVYIGQISLTSANETSATGSIDAVNGLYIGSACKFGTATLSGKLQDVFDGNVDDVRFYAARDFTDAAVTATFNNTKRYYGK